MVMNLLDRIALRPRLEYELKQGKRGNWWCKVYRRGDPPNAKSRLNTSVPGYATKVEAMAEMASLGITPRRGVPRHTGLRERTVSVVEVPDADQS